MEVLVGNSDRYVRPRRVKGCCARPALPQAERTPMPLFVCGLPPGVDAGALGPADRAL